MKQLKKRLKSLAWRAGAMAVLGVLAYTSNISDIREIDLFKIATIAITVASALVVAEGTKYLNKN